MPPKIPLPKKITPDSIREAVVELKYSSTVPFEILIGVFVEAFDESYAYTNRPIQPRTLPVQQAQELKIRLGSESFIYNEKINIRLLPNSIIFSCVDQYIGWETFQREIEKALNFFFSTGKIQEWVRVGLRYITEYPKKDLRECIKFDFTFGLPDVKSISTAFISEFIYEGSRVILNLSNKVPVFNQQATQPPELVPMSIIDVDVIEANLKFDNLQDLLKVIEEVHRKEKEVYFGMLQEDFLKSLNPEY
jgi:uncharacterized protein (TIGR04255 family)